MFATVLAIPGFRWGVTLTITAAVALATLILGLVLTIPAPGTRRREIGLALVAGACFVVGSGLIQAAADINQFRSTLMFTQDLTGFNPEGRSLQGLPLNGKRLTAAQLGGADLRKAHLVRADLTDADVRSAHFEGADLGYAQFGGGTTFAEAHFTGADLRGTRMSGVELSRATFDRALVHQFTCWKLPTKGDKVVTDEPGIDALRSIPTDAGQQLLDKLLKAKLRPNAAGDGLQPIGHICTKKESGVDRIGALAESRRMYICLTAPHLRTFAGDPHKVAFKC